MAIRRALRDYTAELPEIGGTVAFEVSEAETGEQALEQIAEEPPHILLLDHKLPGISGIDVLEQLPTKRVDMLTIMITAYASIETAVRATKQGAHDFLPKPFTPDELKATLRKASEHLIVSRQARRLAEEKNRVRFEFISVVAHELKSPINAIEGYLNVLKSGAANENPALSGEIIERCSTRIGGMRKMITDLLDLTRIESGQKKREFEELDVCEILQMAVETAAPDADARHITLHVDATPPVQMMADRGEIEIILNNLISNAVKYNRDAGRVDIRVRRRDQEVVLSVSDTGIGMTEEQVAKLFQDFVRIKTEQTQHILGSGLGLSILKKLAHLYGGEVKVKSRPEEGSTFTVVLRSAPPAEPGETAEQA